MSSTFDRLPLVALIGLPNSGKSTLINKIIGGNRAITDKIAHTTRDLLYGEDNWNGLQVKYVDTGGLVPNPEDKIQKMIQIKSWQAIAESDLLLWVIDRKQDPETISDQIIQRIWKTGKPVFVLINKVDDPNLEKGIADYAKLGSEQFLNISASNGYGLGDLMDEVTNKLLELGFEKTVTDLDDYAPYAEEEQKKGKRAKVVSRNMDGTYTVSYEDQNEKQAGDIDWDNASQVMSVHEFPNLRTKDWRSKPIAISLLGKPNVGKSSLFNSIVGEDIQIVTEIPGTTLSVNDTLYERKLPKPKIRVKNIILDFWGVLFFGDPVAYSKKIVADNLELLPLLKQIQVLLREQVKLVRTEVTHFDRWNQKWLDLTGLPPFSNDVWGEYFTVNPKISKYIKMGHQTYNFYFLTNINQPVFEKCAANEILNCFKGGIASFQTDFRKPDPAIFQALLDKYDLKAEESVFIDDNQANIKTAAELDFQTIYYPNDTVFDKFSKIEPLREIHNLVFDFEDVLYDWKSQVTIKNTLKFIEAHRKLGQKIFYLGNISEENRQDFEQKLKTEILSSFDGGILDYEVGVSAPDPEIYLELVDKYDLNPIETIFISAAAENINTSIDLGMHGILFESRQTNLEIEYEKINKSLGNSAAAAGTQSYLLLDTAGIRKAGQRTLGVETFATFRTIKAVNEADIVLLMFDASTPLTHQDQVVAGIAAESKRGIVVILNKMDLLDDIAREEYIRSFDRKFKFLKVDRVVWTSALKNQNLETIWEAVDQVVESRSRLIDPNEVRKLFNYLMRKKPPQKMTDKKKPVIYDLIFTRQAPPTFELWVRFKETIHWSYTRFLANILAAQFGFTGGQVIVKIVERKSMKLAPGAKNIADEDSRTGRKGSSKVQPREED